MRNTRIQRGCLQLEIVHQVIGIRSDLQDLNPNHLLNQQVTKQGSLGVAYHYAALEELKLELKQEFENLGQTF